MHGRGRRIRCGRRKARRARWCAPWVQAFARCGYVCKGVVYLVLGALALAAAVGVCGGSTTDRNGALLALYRAPLGRWLLAVLAVGLVGFAHWNEVLAALN